MLLNSKETITNMVSKENQLMADLKRTITELGEKQEKYKARVLQTKQEKEAIAAKYETLKKDNENLRELVKIKDSQIEDSRGYESSNRGERDRLYLDNKKLKEMVQKHQSEIKDLVKTLKAFSDEKNRLEKELDKMKTHEIQLGHSNHAQRIQHTLSIKKENNELKDENHRLRQKIRQQMELMAANGGNLNSNATFGNLATDVTNVANQNIPPASASPAEAEKSRKELTGLHESVSRLAE